MNSKKLKVAVLLHKGLLPPNSKKGHSQEEIDEWKVEYDVISTLKRAGHQVFPIEMYGELEPLRSALDEFNPDIAFNLLEEFVEYPLFDQQVVNYLELKKIPYTGCNPRGLAISKDKALSKKIVKYDDIAVPEFFVFLKKRKIADIDYPFPLFVKPLNEEGSIGISKEAVVTDLDKLKARVAFLHEKYQTDVIAEQFIEGREIYVGVLGNGKLITFQPWELILKNEKDAPIFTSRLKWDIKHQKKAGLETKAAKLDKNLNKLFAEKSKEIFRSLKLSGYARMDFKLKEDGKIFLIEANPNPFLAKDEDFAQSAKYIGISYTELINKILNTGLNFKPF